MNSVRLAEHHDLRHRIGAIVLRASFEHAGYRVIDLDHAMAIGDAIVVAVVASLLSDLLKLGQPAMTRLDSLRELVLGYDPCEDKRGERWDELRQAIDRELAVLRVEVAALSRLGTH